MIRAIFLCLFAPLLLLPSPARGGEPPAAVPDRTVVLTFDDGNLSDLLVVAPLLREYGFGATFFMTEGFQGDRDQYMSWDDVSKLARLGFEIGNHTLHHRDCRSQSKHDFLADVEAIETRCREHGIPRPTSFCFPGFAISGEAVAALAEKGYTFARRGGEPAAGYTGYGWGGPGPTYDPRRDHPLLVPSTGVSGPHWSFDDFVRAVKEARGGKIAVLTFHGVPDCHPWVTTPPEKFRTCMKYLHDHHYHCIALRDAAKYVDRSKIAADPFAEMLRQARLEPYDLKCEYATNPLGIDAPQPRFSWKLASMGRGQTQSAYRLLVASSEENLQCDRGDLWDSGKVGSADSVNISYQGKPLASGQKCWWKVRCWNRLSDAMAADFRPSLEPQVIERMQAEAAGPDSPAATFEMGLLHREDWKGRWIAGGEGVSSPLLRKEFDLPRPIRSARVYIAGLGYYELYLNGKKVGDRMLDPASTLFDAHSRSPEVHSRILYATYDVTDQLRARQNVIGVMLGHGWYSGEKEHPGREPYGDRPKLLIQIRVELSNGTTAILARNETWTTSAGPIVANDICNGETYDARREQPGWSALGFDDRHWQPVQPADAPDGILAAQMLPPVRIVETIPAVNLSEPSPGVYVVDFGRHFSGWTRLRTSEPAGTKITLRYAGLVDDKGRLDRRNNRGAEQTDVYITRGDSTDEAWEPRFTLHGFRYVEIAGLTRRPKLDDFQGRVVHSANERVGSFECSNPLLNQIHQNVCRTLETSFQGIPQDAAERDERLGWLGDPGFMAESYFLNYDTAAFWSKWLRDIRDTQKPDGDVPVVAPPHWGSRYDFMPAWKSAYPLFVWYIYRYYGDRQVLAEHYDGLKNLVEFLGGKAHNHIIEEGLGDHMEPQDNGHCHFSPLHTPAALTSTGYYCRDVRILSEAAAVLGKTDDAAHYSHLADEIRAAYNRRFFNETTNQYATGSQTSNALSLHLDLVPPEHRAAVARNVSDDVMKLHHGHLSTGIIGTNALQQVLPDSGYADVMYTIATRTTYPSWGWEIRNDATTVWETWDVNDWRCLNMKMFGSTKKFFYMDVAGVAPAAPDWSRLRFQPRPCGDLTFARASVETPHGRAAVAWRRGEEWLEMNVTVPVNVSATICVPKCGLRGVVVRESGRTCWREGRPGDAVCGLDGGRETADAVSFEAGSGRYAFRLTGTPRTGTSE